MSRIISEALKEYLNKDEALEARERVLDILSKHKYLGEWQNCVVVLT